MSLPRQIQCYHSRADLTWPDSPLKLPTCFKIDKLTNSPFHRTIYFYWSGRKHITPLLLMVDTLVLCLQFVIFYLSRADAERNIVRVDGKNYFTKYKSFYSCLQVQFKEQSEVLSSVFDFSNVFQEYIIP
jgi:hypothetical protein